MRRGQIWQSMARGRSRAVTVEVKRRRGAGARGEEQKDSRQRDGGGGERELTDSELEARRQAVIAVGEEGEKKRDVATVFPLPPTPSPSPPEPAPEPAPEGDSRVASARSAAAARTGRPPRDKKTEAAAPKREESVGGRHGRRGRAADSKAPAPKRNGLARRKGRLTIGQMLDESRGERMRSLAALRRARERERQRLRSRERHHGEVARQSREVVIPETIRVGDLANRMAERGGDVIKVLMQLGVMATINETIDADTAELVVAEFNHKTRRVSEADVERGLGDDDAVAATGETRPPVVTIMGHVDHGKTSLLDALQKSKIASLESGGITQHIGAYQIPTRSGRLVTFIDTPGHEAFSKMRARGAHVTDIAIIVVAADDGVKPQTVEAIRHARAASVPMIIAVNKMDVAGADAERVYQELLQHEVVVEKLGGETLACAISAKSGLHLDKLEEAILLQADLMELQAPREGRAAGVILEAKVERGRGPVATILVKRGILRVGDILVAGAEWGKLRAMLDAAGQGVREAGPATPVQVLGLNAPPAAGDDCIVVESEARGRDVTGYRLRRKRAADAAPRGKLEEMFQQAADSGAREVNLVIKADVQGSVEAVRAVIDSLSDDKVVFKILHGGIGDVNESDVALAATGGALVLAFNARVNPQARALAKRAKVAPVRIYGVIYELLDDMRAFAVGLLEPERKEKELGRAVVRQLFRIGKVGKVAGCEVVEGIVRRDARIRVLRNEDEERFDGVVASLRREKDDAREVRAGLSCGIALEGFQDFKEGDALLCYEREA